MEQFYSSLPEKCGIYIFKDKKGKVLYIGKALNLKDRVRSYFASPIHLGPKTAFLVSKVAKVEVICIESEIEAYLIEARLIKKHQPKYNIDLKDGKTYPQIEISNEKVPRVSFVRRKKDGRAIYFGPFPDVKSARFVLKLARRMFPFRTCRVLPKRPCLYFHLALCPAPCLRSCDLKGYKENIKNLTAFLKGRKKDVLKRLTKKMNRAARLLDFEQAEKIKEQIEKIKSITQPVRVPKEYLEKSNLLEDQRREEIEDLKKILGCQLPVASCQLHRIEAFDVSNLSAKLATGSMVVFIRGEPEKSLYRRFRLRREGKPNDIAMLEEVLRRRFRHREWPMPDLLVVDGGAGQLGAATKVLKEVNLNIPAIGLAKRQEEIYVQKSKKQRAKSEKIRLPKDSPALHLIQRTRDEAHRFAVSYHRKLRRKTFLTPKS